jgi:site-specific DNA-methyltransferase (adenine-specific)
MTKLIHGDCIEEMAKMDADSIDLTVTSPPYDNLRTYEGSLQWNESIWKQVLEGLYRVTREGGVVVWVVGDATIKGSETGTSFKQALYAMECGFNLHDTMMWRKSNPTPNDTRQNRYRQSFEYMFILSKSAPFTCNYIREKCKMAGVKSTSTSQRKSSGSKRTDIAKRRSRQVVNDTKTLENIWTYPVARNKEHPAGFPIQLATDHIRSWSNEGDTVFDPFLGSGTTGLAAKQLNRNFIGIEKVEKYFDIAKERISH